MQKEKRIAVVPGSYDPITIGHVDIIQRSIDLFDEVIIAIGINSDKKYFFPLEQRIEWLQVSFDNTDKVKVMSYSGLTIDFCKANHAKYIVRGLRNNSDFDFERTISMLNQKLNDSVETVFLMSSPECSFISSTIVREIIKYGGNYRQFVPDSVKI